MKAAPLALALAVTFATPSFAEIDVVRTHATVQQALPPAVWSAIQSAEQRTIFPVNGDERYAGQILITDDLVFAPNAKLLLTNRNVPWVAIVAKRVKMADPKAWSTIGRDPALSTAAKGAKGSAGGPGFHGNGENRRKGNPGGPGGTGGPGTAGESATTPEVYFVAEQFMTPDGAPLPGGLRMKFSFNGLGGGAGGEGGAGGPGGPAAGGKSGADGMFGCNEGGGPGGEGGNAGQGGPGGRGGNGANGANIYFVSTLEGIEVLSYARILNEGGMGGPGGRPGRPGSPGAGGQGASGTVFCAGTSPGPRGGYPADAVGGADGTDGNKGSVIGLSVAKF